MAWQSAAINAAATIGGTLLQNRSNKKLAQYSFNKNLDMWEKQNEYNSPKNQMKRLKEAGLNPHLIYGKGTVGNAQTMPQYQALPNSGELFGQSVAGIQGLLESHAKKQTIEMNEMQLWLTANTAYTKAERELIITDNLNFDNKIKFFQAEKEKILTNTERIKNQFWKQGVSPSDSVYLRGLIQLANKFNIPGLNEIIDGLPVSLVNTVEPQYKRKRSNYQVNKTINRISTKTKTLGKYTTRGIRRNDD